MTMRTGKGELVCNPLYQVHGMGEKVKRRICPNGQMEARRWVSVFFISNGGRKARPGTWVPRVTTLYNTLSASGNHQANMKKNCLGLGDWGRGKENHRNAWELLELMGASVQGKMASEQ